MISAVFLVVLAGCAAWAACRQDQRDPKRPSALRTRRRRAPAWLLTLCGVPREEDTVHVPTAALQLTGLAIAVLAPPSIAVLTILDATRAADVAIALLAVSPIVAYVAALLVVGKEDRAE